MSNVLYVTPAQVLAAKLSIELAEEAGEVPSEALKAIANAEVVDIRQLGPSQQTRTDEPTLSEVITRLQRIEHQLQVHNPEASRPDQTPPSTEQTPASEQTRLRRPRSEAVPSIEEPASRNVKPGDVEDVAASKPRPPDLSAADPDIPNQWLDKSEPAGPKPDDPGEGWNSRLKGPGGPGP